MGFNAIYNIDNILKLCIAAVQETETELTEELWFFEKREEIPYGSPIPSLKHEWRECAINLAHWSQRVVYGVWSVAIISMVHNR